MSPLDVADSRILEAFTKYCHKFQVLTGKTNFFLAKINAYFLAGSTALEVSNYYWQFLGKPTIFFVLIVKITFTFLFLFLAYQCDKTEQEKTDNTKTANIFLMLFSKNRKFYFLAVTFQLIFRVSLFYEQGYTLTDLFQDTYFFLAFCFCYFIAVDPLPPAKSKIKKLLETLSSLGRKKVLISD